MNTALAPETFTATRESAGERTVAELLIAAAERPRDPEPLAKLGTYFARAGRLSEARVSFQRALSADARNLDALWGLYDVEQVLGNLDAALAAQAQAIAIAPVVKIAPMFAYHQPAETPVSVLMLCAPGGFQANTPLEYIADGAGIQLHKWYLNTTTPESLPEHDVVFNAIGHDPHAGPVLELAQAYIDAQSRPVINEPRLIPYLGRDLLAERFRQSPFVQVAPVDTLDRQALAARNIDRRVLVRPTASQAGDKLALLRSNEERDNYLRSVAGVEAFYVVPFVDYRSQDGYYRKYRVVFIDGEAYPVHLAISPRWMVHYYNAPMAEHAWMREEEEAFLSDLSRVFTGDLGSALREIGTALPFAYFAIDCAVAPDGKLLLFEADTAMLVHMQDAAPEFAYKRRYVARVAAAVDTMFARRSQAGAERLHALSAARDVDDDASPAGWQSFAADSTGGRFS